jgi:hypothetical protein
MTFAETVFIPTMHMKNIMKQMIIRTFFFTSPLPIFNLALLSSIAMPPTSILSPLNELPLSPEDFRDEVLQMSFRLGRNLSLVYYIILYKALPRKDSRLRGNDDFLYPDAAHRGIIQLKTWAHAEPFGSACALLLPIH